MSNPLVRIEGAPAPGDETAAAALPGATGLEVWRARYAPDLLGEDPALLSALDAVRRVAPSGCSITLRGESGTGKELFARAIHAASPRAEAPLLSINCGAIAEALVESELFGHTRGAFTGATRPHSGLFLAANGGTLFLDEVAELSPATQAKLLRVLQEGELRPVGSTRTKRIDVRVVTASHVDLEQAVADGRFREDLFYRLNVVPITLPPLRDRPSDLESLTLRFVEKYNAAYQCRVLGFDAAFLAALRQHAWPGNVRQLENLVNRLVVTKREGGLGVEDLPPEFGAGRATPPNPEASPTRADPSRGEPVDLQAVVREFERDLIGRALAWADGNKSKAARVLGVRRTTLVAKIQKLEQTASETPLRTPGAERDPAREHGDEVERATTPGVCADATRSAPPAPRMLRVPPSRTAPDGSAPERDGVPANTWGEAGARTSFG